MSTVVLHCTVLYSALAPIGVSPPGWVNVDCVTMYDGPGRLPVMGSPVGVSICDLLYIMGYHVNTHGG